MTDPRLHALVAEWREAATESRRCAAVLALDAGAPRRWVARAAVWTECADALAAMLEEHEPEMHRVAYGEGKTALVSGPVGERMAAAQAADGGSDDEG